MLDQVSGGHLVKQVNPKKLSWTVVDHTFVADPLRAFLAAKKRVKRVHNVFMCACILEQISSNN